VTGANSSVTLDYCYLPAAFTAYLEQPTYTVTWTPEDPIQTLLAELHTLERTQLYEYDILDFEELPTAQIPPDIDTDYPVWAMDIYGFCLVGEDAAAIEHLDEIRAWTAQASQR
jgi:hypothetical protein